MQTNEFIVNNKNNYISQVKKQSEVQGDDIEDYARNYLFENKLSNINTFTNPSYEHSSKEKDLIDQYKIIKNENDGKQALLMKETTYSNLSVLPYKNIF